MKTPGFIIGIVLLVITLMTPLGDNPPAQAAEGPQAAPLSPAFIEFQQNPPEQFYGYIPPTMDLSHLSKIPVEKAKLLLQLPGTYDLRETGKMTSVKNQNSCGTCWLFGTLGAVESRCLVVEDTTYDFSEQNIACCADPAWTYLVGNRCMGGGNSYISSDTLTKKGTRLESCQPYNTSSINSEACYDNCTSIKRLTGFRLVADNGTIMINETKQAIYGYGAVSMGFKWDWGHYNSTTKIYYWPNCTTAPDHMVCLAGWNDSVAWPDNSSSGVWIVKNSWGTGFGDSGYFYLCYGSGNMVEIGSYRYEDYPQNKTVYLYYWDEAGYISSMGYGDNTAWMAGVFNATYEGNLTRVEFWTPSNNASYQAYVYRDGNISNLQNLTAQGNGTCDEAGYYSVTLNTTVSLSSGEPFTIAVNMTTPGYNYPIAIEMAITGTCDPPIQSNATFIRHTANNSWTDTAPSGWNVCLRGKVESPPAIIEGTTYEANATLLPQANVTLKLGGVEKGNTTSNATGYYHFAVTQTGNYTVNVTRGGFTYQEKWANVTALNQTITIITCDFKGMDAPYRTAPDGYYCIKCSNLWLMGGWYPLEFRLDATRVSDVLYAWTHPS